MTKEDFIWKIFDTQTQKYVGARDVALDRTKVYNVEPHFSTGRKSKWSTSSLPLKIVLLAKEEGRYQVHKLEYHLLGVENLTEFRLRQRKRQIKEMELSKRREYESLNYRLSKTSEELKEIQNRIKDFDK